MTSGGGMETHVCIQTNLDLLICVLKPCCGTWVDAGGYNFYDYLQLWCGVALGRCLKLKVSGLALMFQVLCGLVYANQY